MKKNSKKRQHTINDKQNNKDIVNEFVDNFNSLLNNYVVERDSEPQIIPTETSNEIIMSVEDTKAAISLLKGNNSADLFLWLVNL